MCCNVQTHPLITQTHKLLPLQMDKYHGQKLAPQHTEIPYITQTHPQTHISSLRQKVSPKGFRPAPRDADWPYHKNSTHDTQTIISLSHRAFLGYIISLEHTASPPTEHRCFQKHAYFQGAKTHSTGHRHALPPTNTPQTHRLSPKNRDSAHGTETPQGTKIVPTAHRFPQRPAN